VDDTLTHVLRASICWTYRTHDPPFSNSATRPSRFQIRLTPTSPPPQGVQWWDAGFLLMMRFQREVASRWWWY